MELWTSGPPKAELEVRLMNHDGIIYAISTRARSESEIIVRNLN